MLKIGEKAPEFITTTQSGEEINSSGLLGKKYVIYFYPKDNTPGCTKEACSIRDNYSIFQENNIPIYGVSGGSANSHQKFIEKYDLPFPLLMDEKFSIAKKFGAFKKGNHVARITYLINETGIIEGIYGAEGFDKVETAKHAAQLIDFWKL
ncbi:MAG: peroxiredoxin [Candidatus Heimdallarchaeota archaeon]|nr:peroxiredoxin [Candidatus Heimdallarchaeota archaeon]